MSEQFSIDLGPSMEHSLCDHFQTFEDRLNQKIKDGLKRGLKLIIDKMNTQIHQIVGQMIVLEVSKEVQRALDEKQKVDLCPEHIVKSEVCKAMEEFNRMQD